jgi:cephalosporin hydroxylase
MMLEHLNPGARVITVDIENASEEARAMPLAQRRIDFLVGSSTAPEIIADITERVRGKSVLVLLDSDHSQAHVANELELYAPLVTPGSYLIVQDTNVNGHPIAPEHGPGPWEAVAEFLPRHPEFTADRGRERLLFTMHPGGYLRRQPAAGGG